MAQVTFIIPDDQVDRWRTALIRQLELPATSTNAEVRTALIQLFKRWIRRQERVMAAQQAQDDLASGYEEVDIT